MNFKDYRFRFMILIVMITKESHANYIRSKVFPDSEDISQSFADLLNSLATVNQERVDALKKFFKLENYETAKQMLRVGKEDKPLVTLLVIGDDESPITNQIPIYRSKKHKQYNYEDSDSDSSSSSDYSETDDRKDIIDKNLRMHKVQPKRDIEEVLSESSHEVVSSENKPITNEVLISSSSKEDVPPKPASRYCSTSSRHFGDCVYSCKEAYRYACSHYNYCSNTLYSRLRRECRYSCKKRFYYYR